MSIETMIESLRWLLAVPLLTAGAIVFGIHLWMLVWGVILKHPIPSPLVVANTVIILLGLMLLPVKIGNPLTLACAAVILLDSILQFAIAKHRH